MIEQTRPFLVSLGKAKAAKLVRNLLDLCLMIDDQDGDIKVNISVRLTISFIFQVGLCKECIEWATDQNRVFLRQTLQARLVRLYNDLSRHQEALALCTLLSFFVNESHLYLQQQSWSVSSRRSMTKTWSWRCQLEESKACYYLGNLSKARAALTSARTTANSIYTPPKMQVCPFFDAA